jgi:hypothetical protein
MSKKPVILSGDPKQLRFLRKSVIDGMTVGYYDEGTFTIIDVANQAGSTGNGADIRGSIEHVPRELLVRVSGYLAEPNDTCDLKMPEIGKKLLPFPLFWLQRSAALFHSG